MKRIVVFLSLLLVSAAALAQTPQEIISRMEDTFNAHESEGLIMTVEIKIPILGSIATKTYSLGSKLRMDASSGGTKVISWYDGKTSWTYTSDKNEIPVKKDDGSSAESGDTAMFSGITEGYDVTLKEETADAWYFICHKSKTNKEKDAPKKIDLVISKGTYYPKKLSASMSSVTMTMRDIDFGVSEEMVTFNPDNYPGATIVDKR